MTYKALVLTSTGRKEWVGGMTKQEAELLKDDPRALFIQREDDYGDGEEELEISQLGCACILVVLVGVICSGALALVWGLR